MGKEEPLGLSKKGKGSLDIIYIKRSHRQNVNIIGWILGLISSLGCGQRGWRHIPTDNMMANPYAWVKHTKNYVDFSRV